MSSKFDDDRLAKLANEFEAKWGWCPEFGYDVYKSKGESKVDSVLEKEIRRIAREEAIKVQDEVFVEWAKTMKLKQSIEKAIKEEEDGRD